jgi:hypothetical protein
MYTGPSGSLTTLDSLYLVPVRESVNMELSKMTNAARIHGLVENSTKIADSIYHHIGNNPGHNMLGAGVDIQLGQPRRH